MPSIPVVPIALAASLGGLYYVDMKYKDLMATTGAVDDNAAHEKSLAMKKKMRYGLMGTSVVLCLAIVYNCVNNKRAKSSFENRVTNASNALRSSMNLSSAQPQSASSDAFSARVSEAAAELRRQLATTPGEPSSSGRFSPPVEDLSAANLSSADLAAKASAEISSFIAENS